MLNLILVFASRASSLISLASPSFALSLGVSLGAPRGDLPLQSALLSSGIFWLSPRAFLSSFVDFTTKTAILEKWRPKGTRNLENLDVEKSLLWPLRAISRRSRHGPASGAGRQRLFLPGCAFVLSLEELHPG